MHQNRLEPRDSQMKDGNTMGSILVAMETPDTETPALTADRPITTAEEDLFDRQTYVHSLADALRHADAEHGLVVGINGPWGSGKTSLKNLLIEEMITTRSQGVDAHFIEFEPWMFSGSGRLVSLMFSQIAQDLHPKSEMAKRNAARAAQAAGKISEFVDAHEDEIKEVIGCIPVPGLRTVTKQTLKAFRLVAQASNPQSDDIDKLAQRREKLKKNLSKSDSRIIVFIDDLDRLMDDEIIDMLRAVKAVGDLPNMTYVLLYDREVLTKSLDKTCHNKGDEFLEKIIQVPIRLPEPPQEQIKRILEKKIHSTPGLQNKDLLTNSFENIFNPSVFNSCVLPFLNTPRDANRLFNEFRLRYTTLKDDVEPEDLLAITSLEVFHSSLHRWIINHKNLLCSPTATQFNFQGKSNQEEQRVEELQESLSSCDASDVERLKSLFPFVRAAYQGNWSFSSTRGNEPKRSLCLIDHFDAYFRLSLDEGMLHESAYRQFLLNDTLDDHDLDDEHLKIFNDRFFARKAAMYLARGPIERLRTVLVFCLKCDQHNRINCCRSISVVAEIIHETGRNSDQSSVASQIIEVIIESVSPTVMPLCAHLFYSICKELKADNEEIPYVEGMEYFDLMISESNHELWENIESKLEKKLMTPLTGSTGMLFDRGVLIPCFAELRALFVDDDLGKVLTGFRSAVDTYQFAVFAGAALVDERDGSYSLRCSAPDSIVPSKDFTAAIDYFIDQGTLVFEARKILPLAAAFRLLVQPDAEDTVTKGEADTVVRTWIERNRQTLETQTSQ